MSISIKNFEGSTLQEVAAHLKGAIAMLGDDVPLAETAAAYRDLAKCILVLADAIAGIGEAENG